MVWYCNSVNIKSKQQSIQWYQSNSPEGKNSSNSNLHGDYGHCFLGPKMCFLLVNFMEMGATIIAEVYCKTLSKLKHAIQLWCWHGMLMSGFVLIHDNMWVHTAAHKYSIPIRITPLTAQPLHLVTTTSFYTSRSGFVLEDNIHSRTELADIQVADFMYSVCIKTLILDMKNA